MSNNKHNIKVKQLIVRELRSNENSFIKYTRQTLGSPFVINVDIRLWRGDKYMRSVTTSSFNDLREYLEEAECTYPKRGTQEIIYKLTSEKERAQ